MVRKKKGSCIAYGVDPEKVEDMQKLADELKELNKQEFAYISGAIQAVRISARMQRCRKHWKLRASAKPRRQGSGCPWTEMTGRCSTR